MSENDSDATDEALPGDKVEKRKARRANEEDYRCANFLYGALLDVNKEAKAPKMDTWAEDIRLMREIDKRSHEGIKSLFRFAKSDPFWSPNIQSPGKLREKWDVLIELRNRPGRTEKAKDPAFFGLAAIDHSAGVKAMEANMKLHGTVVSDDDDLSFDLPGKKKP